MRTTRNFAIGLVTALTFASCTTELPFNQAVENAQLEKEVSFWAYHSDGDTKSVLGDGGSVLWSPNDSICVYFGSQYQQGNITKFVSDNSSPASSARFTGKMPNSIGREGGDGYYYAFYPYDKSTSFSYGSIYYEFPYVQFARKGSFGEKTFPSVARSKDLQLFFYNICGGIKLTVTKPGIQKIRFKSNAGEYLSGRGGIYINEDGRPYIGYFQSDASSSVDLLAPEGGFEVGAPYYVILPPQTYTQGFTITFFTDTEQAERVIDKSVTIERSIFSKLTNADQSLTYTKMATALELLSGTEGKKYWLWDIVSENGNGAYGDGGNDGNGYPADEGRIPNGWWYTSPESLSDTEGNFAYMAIDSEANCVTYSESGQEVRKGKITISGFNASRRADGWSVGKFSVDSPATLWPYSQWSSDPITEFDILKLTEDELILAYNENGTTTGNNGTYYWWRFRSVDKATFEKGRPAGIALDNNSIVVYQGFDFDLKATITPEDRSFWGIYWTIDKDNLVYHNGNGNFYAYSSDEAGDKSLTITAKTAGGLSASCDVTIKRRIPVTSFKFEENHFDMLEGETVTAKATVLPENATLREITWESKDTNVATVDENGVITAIGPGWTNIIATTDGGNWNCWLSVYVRDKSVGGISFDKWYIEMYPGDSETITASIYPEYAENQNVIWSSLNPEIAVVDDKGKVTAIATGWAQIMAETEENGYTAYCSIYVQPRAVTGISLDISSAELFVGDRLLLTASLTPENATNQTVTWRSDKTDVATVDKSGLVKAVGSGSATITATTRDGGFTASCKITARSNGVEPGVGEWEEGEHHEGGAY